MKERRQKEGRTRGREGGRKLAILGTKHYTIIKIPSEKSTVRILKDLSSQDREATAADLGLRTWLSRVWGAVNPGRVGIGIRPHLRDAWALRSRDDKWSWEGVSGEVGA